MGYRRRSLPSYHEWEHTREHRSRSGPRQLLLKPPERAKDQVKLIRQVVKAECPTLSVKMARGTAYGWVDISGSADKSGSFTEKEKEALRNLSLRPGVNFANIDPSAREYYLRLWGVIY